ncbi:MAG: alpha/beta hydrolase, partial [Chloroflexota bacterium]
MASPQLDAIKQMLKGRPAERADQSAQDARAGFETITQMLQVQDDTKREKVTANGVPGEWITNGDSTDATTIYYLHGGGYSIGSVNTHATMISQIARASKARAFA